MRGISRASVTATAGTAVALCTIAPRPFLVGALILIGLCIAWGWVNLLELPFAKGSITTLAVVAIAAPLVGYYTQELAWATLLLAFGFIGAILSELARRDGRAGATYSLAGTVAGVAVIVSAMGWLTVGTTVVAVGLVVCAAVTLIVTSITVVLPGPGWIPVLATLIAGLGAGAGVGYAILEVGTTVGLVLGLAMALLSISVGYVAERLPGLVGFLPGLALGLLPVAVASAPVYVVWRFLVG